MTVLKKELVFGASELGTTTGGLVCEHCTAVNCSYHKCQVITRPRKQNKYTERAKCLIDTFSNPDGSGSHTMTCTNERCSHPKCLCT